MPRTPPRKPQNRPDPPRLKADYRGPHHKHEQKTDRVVTGELVQRSQKGRPRDDPVEEDLHPRPVVLSYALPDVGSNQQARNDSRDCETSPKRIGLRWGKECADETEDGEKHRRKKTQKTIELNLRRFSRRQFVILGPEIRKCLNVW